MCECVCVLCQVAVTDRYCASYRNSVQPPISLPAPTTNKRKDKKNRLKTNRCFRHSFVILYTHAHAHIDILYMCNCTVYALLDFYLSSCRLMKWMKNRHHRTNVHQQQDFTKVFSSCDAFRRINNKNAFDERIFYSVFKRKIGCSSERKKKLKFLNSPFQCKTNERWKKEENGGQGRELEKVEKVCKKIHTTNEAKSEVRRWNSSSPFCSRDKVK